MNIIQYASKQLKEKEEVVRIVRRHPAVVIPGLLLGAFIILLDFFLIAWWFKHPGWGGLGFIVMLIVGAVVVARTWYVWSMNALVITNQRIIDINQNGWWQRTVSETTYEKIQDVRYTIHGFWSTIFHFGSLEIQTAGNDARLELSGIAHPVELQQQITDIQARVSVPSKGPLSADELISMVDQLRNHLGPEELEKLLHRKKATPDA